MSKEAMKQAIDFAEYCLAELDLSYMASNQAKRLIEKSRQAIAEAEKQEPVELDIEDLSYSAYEEAMSFGLSRDVFLRYFKGIVKHHTHPQPKREWVGLTDEEQDAARYRWLRDGANMELAHKSWQHVVNGRGSTVDALVDAHIKAAHGIKE